MSNRALETYEAYCYARDAGHLDFVTKAEACDNYFVGQQWDTQVANRMRALGKPMITLNKTLSTCAAVFGEQLQNRADVSFRPARSGTEEIAATLDKIWLHLANNNAVDWLESEIAADGFIRSRGFFDARIEFDDHMQGEVRITQLNSKNVVIDPDAETYDPDGWKEVFVTKWLTQGDLAALYGEDVAKEMGNRPSNSFQYQYDSLDWLPDNFGSREWVNRYGAAMDSQTRRLFRIVERQYRERRMREHFVDLNTGDMRPVPEKWSRDRIAFVTQEYGFEVIKRKVEQIRWTTICSDVEVHDSWSPYKHFTPVPFFPFFRHGKTIGIVENIMSPQDLLNKSVSQELHIVNTTANSGYKVKAGVLANMTLTDLEERGGEDGLVIEVHDMGGLEKFTPNSVPTGLDRVSFKADEALKEVSMVSDSMRGFDRADVAAKAIRAKQARGTVSMAKPFENLAQTRKLLARNVLDLVQEFYTETRVLNIVGRDINAGVEQLTINQPMEDGSVLNDLTVGEYSVVVTTVPARDTYEQSQFQEALEMRQAGIAIPDDVLIEHSHLSRKTEIAKRLTGDGGQEQQMLQQMQLQAMQLDLALKEAQVNKTNAQAAAQQAKAQKDAMEQQGAPDQAAQLQTLAQIERDNMAAAAEQEREMERLQMERAKLMSNLDMTRAKNEHGMRLASAKTLAQIQLNKEKTKNAAQSTTRRS